MPNISVVPGTGSRRRYYPKYRVSVGPFSGGLNTIEDARSLASTELQRCVNLVPTRDGTLKLRPDVNLDVIATLSGELPFVLSDNIHFNQLSQVDDGFIAKLATATNTINFFDLNAGAWNSAFAALNVGSVNVYPIKILYYNGFYYLLTSQRLYRSPNTSTGFTEVATGTVAATKSDMVIVKDRLFFTNLTASAIYWSKATDFTVWAAPDGGSVLLPQSNIKFLLNYQDALYVFTDKGIWRLTFTSDPAIDGVFQRINSSNVGGVTVYNNEVFITTKEGLYKLINGFLSEISVKVRTLFRSLTSTYQPFTDPLGLCRIGQYLLVGPFSYFSNAYLNSNLYPHRGTKFRGFGGPVGYFYLVYDLELNIWTSWEFNPLTENSGTVWSAGPTPITQSVGYRLPILEINDRFIWAAAGQDNTGNVINGFFSMAKTKLSNPGSGSASDSNNGLAASWIGSALTTGEIDLGDTSMWKRFFKTVLTAAHNATNWITASTMNIIVDGNSNALANVVSGSLPMGKSFRGKKIAFKYDSITGTQPIGNVTTPEITDIRTVEYYVSLSQEISTAS